MNFIRKKSILVLTLALIIILTACTVKKEDKKSAEENKDVKVTESAKTDKKEEKTTTKSDSAEAKEVEIVDNRGTHKVKVNPSSVVVLDSRSYKTVEDWGVNVKAAPKLILPPNSKIKKNEAVKDLGNHREPKFEILAAENPEVVIVGQRFIQHFDTIKELLPNATVLDIDINLKNSKETGKSLIEGLKRNTEILGKVFNKNKEAEKLISDFNKSLENVKSKKTDKKFVGLIVSGGKIGYSAPITGRVWGPVFTELNLNPALEIKNASQDHKGDEISVESIAQSNPDGFLVLDRDAAYDEKNTDLAKGVIDGSQVLANTAAVKNKKVFYAPKDTYANESIQTWTNIFNDLAKFLQD